jgi:hypothetical protein
VIKVFIIINSLELKESIDEFKEDKKIDPREKTRVPVTKPNSQNECPQTVDFCSYMSAVIYNTFNRKFDSKTANGKRLEQIRNKILVSDKVRDFNYILDKMTEVDVLKDILLNEHQSLCLSYLKKPRDIDGDTPHRFSSLVTGEEDNRNIIQRYFTRILNQEALVGNDEILFRRLDDKLREKVLSRIANVPTQ